MLAMGWKLHEARWRAPDWMKTDFPFWSRLRNYGTDPLCIPEMLAWLWAETSKRCAEPCVSMTISDEKSYWFAGDCVRNVGTDYMHCTSYFLATSHSQQQEALAKLCVMVAGLKQQ